MMIMILSSCGIFNSGSEPSVIVIQDRDCLFGIKIFNDQLSQRVIEDIALVLTSGNKSRIDELTEMYPEFRDAWNGSLSDISRNYRSDYRVSAFPVLTSTELANPRSVSSSRASRFYLLLFSFIKGPYPSGSRDMERLAAYKEQGDLGNYLNNRLRILLQENCRRVTAEQVRNSLRPVRMPDRITDCLHEKT